MNEKLTIQKASSDSIHCDYFPACSGCKKQDNLQTNSKHQALEAALNQKVPFYVDGIAHYRHKVKLAIGGTAKKPKIGLYKENSHEIVSILTCPLHTDGINQAIYQIKQAIIESHISIYSEKSLKGVLRYVQIVEENQSKKLGVTFVVNGKLSSIKNHPFFNVLKEKMKNQLVSLWLNEKTTADNVIFGKNFFHLYGKQFLEQKLLEKVFYFHPATFCQVHLKQYENLLLKLRSWLNQPKRVLELYGGVGTIGLSLLGKITEVDCYESNPYSKISYDHFEKIDPHPHFHYFNLPSEAFEEKEYDLVIIDPPRKGISKEVMSKILSMKTVKEIVMVYCDLEAFLKDYKILLEKGCVLKEIAAYLFFPGTEHIEILAKIEKESE
jgi:23S rRNA (uracil1939-C5)-methyltransferase